MAANFRSLVGGFYSSNPGDLSVPRSIRTNNPLALNISEWQKTFPGYVGYTQPDSSANANRTTIYETPEHGFAAWYHLMGVYQKGGHNTVGKIINHYGGGQDYSGYLKFVVMKEPSLTADTVISLDDDDKLIKLARVMAWHEAGRPIPWTNDQIKFGISLGRQHDGGEPAPRPVPVPETTTTTVTKTDGGFWAMLFALLRAIFGLGPKPFVTARILRMGDVSPRGGDVWQLQERLRALGFTDIVIDGEFGPVTDHAVRTFQDRENLDPDGEVGDLTLDALNRVTTSTVKPPLNPPPVVVDGVMEIKPAWYVLAEKDIGFHETGNNRGIERFIAGAKTGQIGDPWCAIGVNYWLETSGQPGTRSAAARSFEKHGAFIKLDKPTLGCIVTQWRTSKTSGFGHVFLADGIDAAGNIRGIGANENDMVKRSMHDKARVTGYWWPKAVPVPKTKLPLVSSGGAVVTRET